MDSPGPIQIVTLIILIFLSGFFSSAESMFIVQAATMEAAAARVNKIFLKEKKVELIL